MLKSNSPTVQSMIDSVKTDGITGSVNPTQFQAPFPSPKDMVMNMGSPMGYGYGYQIPPTIQYQQQYIGTTGPMVQTFREIPGAPVNPDLAHLSGQSIATQPAPGRFMNVPNQTPLYGKNFVGQLNSQPTPIQNFSIPSYQQWQQQNMPPQHYGELDMYNGAPVHPGVYSGWYGSQEYPFYREGEYQNNLRNKFAERFPGYYNPYASNGFMRPIELQTSPEVRQTTALAAYYGMSYEEFVGNSISMYKKLCRVSASYFHENEEIIKKKEKAFEIKKPTIAGQEPDNDEELFYPMGAFDVNGRLTYHYMSLFCVNRERIKKYKSLRVGIKSGDKVVECKRRSINYLTSMERIDKAITEDARYRYWIQMNNYRMAQQYWSAPERQIDHIEGNVFEVTAKALNFAAQKELERKWAMQRSTRSAYSFNREDFLTDIKALYARSRASVAAKRDKEWSDLISKVADNAMIAEAAKGKSHSFYDRPFIVDGDWVIAKPGVDIVGLPLDQSVNKIIKMNTVTGEEEIYDPGKMMGLDVRERIKESMTKQPFTEIEGPELEKRLESFKTTEFADF